MAQSKQETHGDYIVLNAGHVSASVVPQPLGSSRNPTGVAKTHVGPKRAKEKAVPR